MDVLSGPPPKRGDLLQTNVGDRRERTWLILRVRRIKREGLRYELFAARWWEIEPEMRMALWRSAERNGGQGVYFYKRYPAKKRKRTFEQYMARN